MDVEPANRNRVTFGGVSGGDDAVSVAWTNVSGLTNPWAKGSRPPQRQAPTPATWKMYCPEDEDDYEEPEPDVYELARLAAAEARLADEADLDFDRPNSPLQTRPSTRTSFAEMQVAMAGIDFNPDPTEIQIGGGDSPRLLSTTESHQKLMVESREKTRKAHREGKRASHDRTLLISHTGREGGKGAKNPKHQGIESFTAPRKFANTGRVHKKSHGSYLHKAEERPVQKPKGKHPFKKELADVSFEVVSDVPPKPESGGVYRQPKKKPKVPRVVAVARPILSGALKRPASAGARIAEPEPEPEPEPDFATIQALELGPDNAGLEVELAEAHADTRGAQASLGSVAIAARPRREVTAAGHLDRSSRVRHAPGSRPQRPHEKAWARHPARGEWYLADSDEAWSGVDLGGIAVSASVPDMLICSGARRRNSNGVNWQREASAASLATAQQRSKLEQRRGAREQRERQRRTLMALS